MLWPGEARADKAKVDAVLSGAVTAGNVTGVVAVAADDKGVIYEGAFGKRNLSTGTAMTPDTIFWIASMTKAVTSIAAMQMVEQGKLSLDKPISDVVMELSAAQVLEGFDADGKLSPIEFGMPHAPEFFMGGGALYSTGRDYLPFCGRCSATASSARRRS